MTCVDILSQLHPIAADDPFADWVTFEENNDNFQSIHTQKSCNDGFDILTYLELNDEKHDETQNKNENKVPPLLDFSNTNVWKPLLSTNLSHKPAPSVNVNPAVRTLQLRIVGLNVISTEPEKVATNLNTRSTVRDLKKLLKKRYKLEDNIGLLLIYTNFVLLHDHNTLQSYGICNGASIFAALCEDVFRFNSFLIQSDADAFASVFNAQSTAYFQFERNQMKIVNELNKLIGFVCEYTKDLDILSYEMVSNCIKMPCSHGMTCDTLYSFVESQLNSNHEFIKCPHILSGAANNDKCNEIWHYPIIRYILTESRKFKTEQIMKLEIDASWITFKTHYMISKCSNCQYNIYRHSNDDKERKKGHCPLCVNTFCWSCGGIWKNKSSETYCGNEECVAFEKEYLEILSMCPSKAIGSVFDVPTIRACPKCSQLIQHSECCKHMKCTRCDTNFCFVCLKEFADGKWQCGDSDSVCEIAPRQTIKDAEALTKQKNNVSFDDIVDVALL